LDAWYAEAKKAKWASFQDIKNAHRSADNVGGDRVVFNIGGNKFRLVVKIAYKSGTVYVRFVDTHAEYDKIDATKV
jgi:mRNA interferase HigB